VSISTNDLKNKSRCTGSCAVYWLPLVTLGKPVAGRGVRKSFLGRTRRHDGTVQVTYAGHPLYRFFNDSQPGQTNGERYNGKWYVIGANGKKR